MIIQFHPDRNNTPGTPEKFVSIAEAYTILSHGQRKAIYDQFGVKGLKNGVPPRDDFLGFAGGYMFHGDADQVFNDFFGTKNPFSGRL
jgi:DnaJ family protein B protein 13